MAREQRIQRLKDASSGRGPRVGIVSMYDVENNAVRILAATLREAGHHVTEIYFKDWVNNRFPWPAEVEVQSLIELLRERRIDVIAFSGQMPSGERFALFDTRRGNGGYVELMEISTAMEASLDRMHAAHCAWDGIDRPVRSIADLG